MKKLIGIFCFMMLMAFSSFAQNTGVTPTNASVVSSDSARVKTDVFSTTKKNVSTDDAMGRIEKNTNSYRTTALAVMILIISILLSSFAISTYLERKSQKQAS